MTWLQNARAWLNLPRSLQSKKQDRAAIQSLILFIEQNQNRIPLDRQYYTHNNFTSNMYHCFPIHPCQAHLSYASAAYQRSMESRTIYQKGWHWKIYKKYLAQAYEAACDDFSVN